MLDTECGAGFRTPIVLRAFSLVESQRSNASLELAVEGEDRIGFLSALLRRLAYGSLFPVAFSLDTRGDRVLDRFWLRQGRSDQPDDRAARRVRAQLEALIQASP